MNVAARLRPVVSSTFIEPREKTIAVAVVKGNIYAKYTLF